MKIAFWVSLTVILYTYAGYPVIIWALSGLRPRRWTRAAIEPSVSIIMAVHNGEALLVRKIDHLLHLNYPNIQEIVVVSDGSTDHTAEILLRSKGRKLRPIILQEHGGKAVALNAGMAAASGDIFLFVDLRPEIALGAIARLVSNFADSSVGCVTGELLLKQDGHDGTAAAVGGLYWRYEQWIRICESLWDSPVGVYGGFYAIRRELATAFPAGIILDDMFQPLAIIRKGFRCVIDRDALVYDSWPKKVRGEFHRKVRTLAGNFQMIRLAPWIFEQRRIVLQLISHKVLRLMVPYMLALLLISSIALFRVSMAFAIIAALQIMFWVMAAIGMRYELPWLNRGTHPASALLMLNAAAVVGFYKFLFRPGPLWKMWGSQQVTDAVEPKGKAREEPRPKGLFRLIASDILAKAEWVYESVSWKAILKALLTDGTFAMILYRLMQVSQGMHLVPLAMVFNKLNVILGGCIIGRRAQFGPGFVLVHSSGVVINTAVRGGAGIKIEHQVTIGAERNLSPVLGDNIFIGAGAKIIGAIKIGSDVRIGANAVVVMDLPEGVTAVGVPARIIGRKPQVELLVKTLG